MFRGRVQLSPCKFLARYVLSGLCVFGLSLGAAPAARAQTADSPATAESASQLLAGEVPVSISDLRAMQERIQEVARQVLPCTVGVRVGQAHGSGVIIDPHGYVLTAAHVAGAAGQPATIMLATGETIEGRTLGLYRTMDAGLIKITSYVPGRPRLWPHAEMGKSADVVLGQWCLATGHPGGFERGRQPALRVGRVLSINEDSAITTDCTLIGGDSGGPLFDADGHVIGIHSRIGGALHVNLHVPVDTFRQEWDRLAAGDEWGHTPGTEPYIGVQGVRESAVAQLETVTPESPASRAGLQAGDVITGFGGKAVTDFASLKNHVADHQPGSTVIVEVDRGDQRILLELVVGNRRQ